MSTNLHIIQVPADVWREIFAIVVAAAEDQTDKTLVTLRFTWVCSTWRTIASEAPELWTHINMVVKHNGELRFMNVQFLSLILQNASGMPLTMKLSNWLFRPRPSRPLDIQLLILFLQNTFRAKSLEVPLTALRVVREWDYAAYKEVVERIQVASKLEEVALDFEGDYMDLESLSDLASLWSDVPLLHKLCITGPWHQTWCIRSVNVVLFQTTGFPFDQLTVLDLSASIALDAFLKILSFVPHLVQGEFSNIRGTIPPEDARPEPIDLPRLRELKLRGHASKVRTEAHEYPPMTELLVFFKAPSLKSLHLISDRDWSQEGFETFLDNSSCRIEHLGLDIEDSDEETKIQCLRMLPWLKCLEIQRHRPYVHYSTVAYLEHAFAGAMRSWNGRFDICPNLQQLIVDYDSLFDKSQTVLADMVEERWSRMRGDFKVVLNKAEIHGDSERTLGEIARLLTLKSRGLDVTISPRHWLERIICR